MKKSLEEHFFSKPPFLEQQQRTAVEPYYVALETASCDILPLVNVIPSSTK
jgi:hypothetical protein